MRGLGRKGISGATGATPVVGVSPFPLSPLRPPDTDVGEYPARELSGPARTLLILRRAIGLRCPLVETGTALLSVLVVWRFGIGWESVAALVLT